MLCGLLEDLAALRPGVISADSNIFIRQERKSQKRGRCVNEPVQVTMPQKENWVITIIGAEESSKTTIRLFKIRFQRIPFVRLPLIKSDLCSKFRMQICYRALLLCFSGIPRSSIGQLEDEACALVKILELMRLTANFTAKSSYNYYDGKCV